MKYFINTVAGPASRDLDPRKMLPDSELSPLNLEDREIAQIGAFFRTLRSSACTPRFCE